MTTEQTIMTFAAGSAWYIPAGKSQGEYPVNSVVLIAHVETERGCQYVNGTLFVAPECPWESYIERVTPSDSDRQIANELTAR